MDNIKCAGTLLKSRALGPVRIHDHHDIGLQDPQAEVAVWLCGPDGDIRDVTYRNVMACVHPFKIGIGLEDNGIAAARHLYRASTIRWDVSTLPPQMAAGGRAFTIVPSGAIIRSGRMPPALEGIGTGTSVRKT